VSEALPACDRRRRRACLAWGLGLLAIFPLAVVLVRIIPAGGRPVCPFLSLTAIPCPLCGCTRAFALAMQGAWREALALNPAWPAAAALILALGSLLVFDALTGRSASALPLSHLSRRGLWYVGALLVFWLIQLAL
jgi:hypothetical protein